VIAAGALLISLALFGKPFPLSSGAAALFVLCWMSFLLSPRRWMAFAWPTLTAAALSATAGFCGPAWVVPICLAGVGLAELIARISVRDKGAVRGTLEVCAILGARAFVGASFSWLFGFWAWPLQSPVGKSAVFLFGWYAMMMLQASPLRAYRGRVVPSAATLPRSTLLLEIGSNVLAGVSLAAIVDKSPVLFPLLMCGPIAAIGLLAVFEGKLEERLSEGLAMLHRMLQPTHGFSMRHMQRVAEYGKLTALRLGIPEPRAELVEMAAIVHDIGKVAIDERVLEKPGKLTPEEMEHVRMHAVIGSEVLSSVPAYQAIARWVRHHHERIDGEGYPDKLVGDSIPLESRIIAVVDAYDAMVGGPSPEDQRAYRTPLSPAEAREELRRCSGTQFDAHVVEAFIGVAEELQNV